MKARTRDDGEAANRAAKAYLAYHELYFFVKFAWEIVEPGRKFIDNWHIVDLHPDVCTLAWRFGRAHHHADFSSFKKTRLIPRPGVVIPEGIDNYGMNLRKIK